MCSIYFDLICLLMCAHTAKQHTIRGVRYQTTTRCQLALYHVFDVSCALCSLIPLSTVMISYLDQVADCFVHSTFTRTSASTPSQSAPISACPSFISFAWHTATIPLKLILELRNCHGQQRGTLPSYIIGYMDTACTFA